MFLTIQLNPIPRSQPPAAPWTSLIFPGLQRFQQTQVLLANEMPPTASQLTFPRVALSPQVRSSHPNHQSRTLPAKFARPTTALLPAWTSYLPTLNKLPSTASSATSVRRRLLVQTFPAPVEARSLPSAILLRYLLALADVTATVLRAREIGLSLIAAVVVADTAIVALIVLPPVTTRNPASPSLKRGELHGSASASSSVDDWTGNFFFFSNGWKKVLKPLCRRPLPLAHSNLLHNIISAGSKMMGPHSSRYQIGIFSDNRSLRATSGTSAFPTRRRKRGWGGKFKSRDTRSNLLCFEPYSLISWQPWDVGYTT